MRRYSKQTFLHEMVNSPLFVGGVHTTWASLEYSLQGPFSPQFWSCPLNFGMNSGQGIIEKKWPTQSWMAFYWDMESHYGIQLTEKIGPIWVDRLIPRTVPFSLFKPRSGSNSKNWGVNGQFSTRVGRISEQYFIGHFRAHVWCLCIDILCGTSLAHNELKKVGQMLFSLPLVSGI